ncbi:MAG: hypothetical protein LC776_17480, partial [Acidobacteria bacterium]|nr:hypothetical protein [Acidobacteriota bacterium]
GRIALTSQPRCAGATAGHHRPGRPGTSRLTHSSRVHPSPHGNPASGLIYQPLPGLLVFYRWCADIP